MFGRGGRDAHRPRHEYSRLQARWRPPPERIKEFVARVATLAEIVPPATALREVVLADPDDDAIIHTALSGRAAG